jgi:hypothetical protein
MEPGGAEHILRGLRLEQRTIELPSAEQLK